MLLEGDSFGLFSKNAVYLVSTELRGSVCVCRSRDAKGPWHSVFFVVVVLLLFVSLVSGWMMFFFF